MMKIKLIFVFAMLAFGFGCGSETDADDLGVGAQCAADADCDEESGQKCLDFKGGYCGLENCTKDSECPNGSSCVNHDDGKAYCFLTCVDKATCNENRDADFEANCSSSITFVETSNKGKACVPPS